MPSWRACCHANRYNSFTLCNWLNLKWPPQNATVSDPILLRTARRLAPSSLNTLHSSSDMFFFYSPHPPSPPSHPGLPFSFTSRPIFLFLPLFLPFLQDGQGSSQNTIWNSETSHAAAGLLHIHYSNTLKVLHLLRIRLVLQYQGNYNVFGNYFVCCRKLLAGLQQSNQRQKILAPQAGPEPEARTSKQVGLCGADQPRPEETSRNQ